MDTFYLRTYSIDQKIIKSNLTNSNILFTRKLGHTLMLDAYSSAVAEWTHLLWLERVEDYSSIHDGGLQALPD